MTTASATYTVIRTVPSLNDDELNAILGAATGNTAAENPLDDLYASCGIDT